MSRLAGAALALGLASCFDSLATQQGKPAADIETTTIEPVTFDAVYVVNGESASISVIDAEKDVVAGTIELRGAAYPHHVTVSPDRSLLGIAVPGYDMSNGESGHEHHSSRAGYVLLLNAQTGAVAAATRTNAANHNIVFSPDRQAWTSQATAPGSTLVLDGTSLDVRDSISVGTSPAETVMTADGKLAFVANSGSASVSVIDVPSRTLKTTVAVGAGPVRARPGPNNLLYVENEVDQSVSVVDTTTFNVVRTIPLGFAPGAIAPASNGELWIPAPTRGGVELRDEAGAIVRFVETGPGAYGIVFSSDGTRAYVSNQAEDTVSVIVRETMAVTKKIPVGAKPNGMAWRSR